MANIMINEKCNFKCPYCFASEFTLDKVTNNMSLDDFKYALEFALSSGPTRIGIIGGEPTLHPQFKEIMELLIYDNRVDNVALFTNASNLDKYFPLLTHPKIGMLINYNCETDIGTKNFERVNENIRRLHEEYYLGHKVDLGINMYKPDFEYDYIINMLKKYGKKSVRTSISMPMNVRELDPIEHIGSMMPRVLEFFRELEKIGTYPRYDCNMAPPCVITEEEKLWLNDLARKDRDCNVNQLPYCSPVLDITVDMTAVRCFALSAETKADIRQFKNIAELDSFYMNQVDSFKYLVYASDKCKSCTLAIKGICTGGCLAYKIKGIDKMRELVRTSQEV